MTVQDLKTILALLLLPLAACASDPDKVSSVPELPEQDPEGTYIPIPRAEPKPVGVLLADLDWVIGEWNRLVMTAETDEERSRVGMLERNLAQTVRRRQDDLVAQLETGPPNNRIVAAAALGFTGSDAVMSPLLAALEDPDSRVVGNALLGLAILARPDTPQEPIARLVDSPDKTVRAMAVYAARSITVDTDVEVSEELLKSAHLHLSDQDPFVRSQCALLLAQGQYSPALEDMGFLLYDAEPLVSAAAAKSIAALGRENPRDLPRAAKVLAAALESVDRKTEIRLFEALASLGQSNFGTDVERWVEWAQSLQ